MDYTELVCTSVLLVIYNILQYHLHSTVV